MKDKFEYLNGLRGLAAFAVLIGHFIGAFYPALVTGALSDSNIIGYYDVRLADTPFVVFFNGYFAVEIFFVLSGFVLTHKFFLYKKNEVIVSSAVRRYFRLVIPVAVSCFIAYLLLKFGLFFNDELAVYTKAYWYLPNSYNFEASFLKCIKQAFVDVFIHGLDATPYNAVLWTMQYEFLGSFLVFTFVLIFGKLKNRYIFYIVALLIFKDTHYAAFILGMGLSDLFYNKNKIFSIIKNKLFQIIVLIISLFLGSYPVVVDVNMSVYKYITFDFLGGRTGSMTKAHILGAFLLLFIILSSTGLQKFFSSKILLFLGKISFSMYLMHFMILFSFSSYLFIKLAKYLPYHINFLITFSISLMFILLVSVLFVKYIDEKGIKLSQHMYEKVFKEKNDNKIR